MLAVADQLPVVVLAEDPDASAGTVRASNVQIAEATDFVLTTNPPLPGWADQDEDGIEPRRSPLQNP
jgi:hypothetical protein